MNFLTEEDDEDKPPLATLLLITPNILLDSFDLYLLFFRK